MGYVANNRAVALWKRVVAAMMVVAALVSVAANAGQADNENKANSLYKDAKDKFDARDYDKALDMSEQAEKLFPHPMIVLLKGRILRQMGKLREASAVLKQVKVQAAQLSKPALLVLNDELVGVSDEMRVKGELVVQVEPADARVAVDGTEVKMPYARWFTTGKKRIEAGAPGRKTVVREVELTSGATSEVKINLDRQDGRVVVIVGGGLRGVDVRIDGAPLEIADAQRVGDRAPAKSVEPGQHEVMCLRGDHQVGSKVDVPPGGQVEVRCDGLEPPAGGGKKAAGWGGVAVGAGIFGFGAYNVSYYAYKTSSGFVEKVPEGSVSRLSGGIGYATVGALVGAASWFLLVRDPAPVAASKRPPAFELAWASAQFDQPVP